MPHDGFRMNPDAVEIGVARLKSILDEQRDIEAHIRAASRKAFEAAGNDGPMERELKKGISAAEKEFEPGFVRLKWFADEFTERVRAAAQNHRDLDDGLGGN